MDFFKKNVNGNFAIAIIFGVFAIAFLSIIISQENLEEESSVIFPVSLNISLPQISFSVPAAAKPKEIKKFSSEDDFKAYLAEAESKTENYGGFGGIAAPMAEKQLLSPAPSLAPVANSGQPERVSETNVQVSGIDEPDVVKTDGKEIYFSSQNYWRGGITPLRGISFEEQQKIMAPTQFKAETKIIKAFPPSDLAQEASVDKSGELLLDKNNLVVFSGQDIFGYDVSIPAAPKKKWDITLDNNVYLAGARLREGKIYLVAKNTINDFNPCPIKPMAVKGVPLSIGCQEIYHPIVPVPTDSVFTAMVLDPFSGKIEKNISFVGSSGSSLIYMSENAIYATYSYQDSVIKFFFNFLSEKGKDIAPAWLIEKMGKLESYDISQSAKFLEFQLIWERYLNSIDGDERLKIENEFSNRMSDYYKAHKRELEKTGIVKIKLDGFEIAATGSVPGYPLNQFSLDEYKNYLRVAATVGGRGGFAMGMGGGESANDVYVLDGNLNKQGEVLDLGLTERIYSVRFLEDKGYVVTFRQTDPFYVLDLSNPRKPELKGELKIPGYSSYLHPVAKDKILGVGMESWQVKISLFDVSNAEKPLEIDKYVLDESWSEVASNYHAFLMDKKHEIFFLPGGKGGYIFSYKNDKLSLVKAVSDISAKRAIYINDYLYIIGNDKISVLNETDWEKVNELKF